MPDRRARARPELRVLLAAARPQCDAAQATVLRSALAEVSDWRLLLDLAERHRLTAFLGRHLHACGADLVPPQVLAELAAAQRVISARALGGLRELGTLQRAMAKEGVAMLLYKGPMLSLRAYGDAALRPWLDLDIVVEEERLAAARRAVHACGYRSTQGLSVAQERAVQDVMGQASYLAERDGTEWRLDLHWRMTDRRVPWGPPVSRVLDRAISRTVGGASFTIAGLEDELLLQLLHLARHVYERLEWLVIVRELLATPGLDAATVLERARLLDGRRAVCVGCELARRLVGATLPAPIERAIRADPAVRQLADEIEWALLDLGPLPDELVTLTRLLERPTSRWRATVVAIFWPTLREFEWIRLRGLLLPLYWPLRLLRLVIVRLRR